MLNKNLYIAPQNYSGENSNGNVFAINHCYKPMHDLTHKTRKWLVRPIDLYDNVIKNYQLPNMPMYFSLI